MLVAAFVRWVEMMGAPVRATVSHRGPLTNMHLRPKTANGAWRHPRRVWQVRARADRPERVPWRPSRQLKFLPAAISFIGYNPRSEARTPGEEVRWARLGLGWSRSGLAASPGVDEASV